MSGPLAAWCLSAARELAALGDPGAPLVALATTAGQVAGTRGLDALDDPAFTLDLLLAAPGQDAALVGRVVQFLRARNPSAAPPGRGGVTLAEAVEQYEAGAFRRLAPNSRRTYRTWLRRAVDAYGDRDPATISTGDLVDLLARYATRPVSNRPGPRGGSGRSGEITGVTALRHLWGYLGDKGYADAAIAAAVKKPARPRTSRRRGYRPDEAALVRHLARHSRTDPLLDECVVLLAERALLRREEIVRLRMCDVDLTREVLTVWGKGDEHRSVPITPGLAAFLRRYTADRRPPAVPADAWAVSTERLLRHRPTAAYPHGQRSGRRRIEGMLARFRRDAPALFADGMLCLHSFRHSAATYLDAHFGRAVTRAALGHLSRNSPTDFYVTVSEDALRAALAAYEQHLADGPGEPTQPPGPE